MTRRSRNLDRERDLDDLAAVARQRGLVLFVGAGINARILPTWGQLIENLLEVALQEAAFIEPRMAGCERRFVDFCLRQFDPCACASLVERLLGPSRYQLELQESLYGQSCDVEATLDELSGKPECEWNRDETEKYGYLFSVARLASLVHVRAVATFNYDTLLEAAVRSLGDRRTVAHFGAEPFQCLGKGEDLERPVLPVYHLHGMVPPPHSSLLKCEADPTLSYGDYFDLDIDPFRWETATPLHLLRHYPALWLGTSLRDWNMLRLLHAADQFTSPTQCYCLQCLDDIAGGFPEDERRSERSVKGGDTGAGPPHDSLLWAAMRLQSTLFDAVHVRLIVAGKEHGSLREALSTLVGRMEKVK